MRSNNIIDMKVGSWNVAGLRAWINKGGLDFLTQEDLDIFCLQEVKCTNIPADVIKDGYYSYWFCSGGYAGVAIYSRKKPKRIECKSLDYPGNLETVARFKTTENTFKDVHISCSTEARVITLEYDNFFLVNTYVPKSGRCINDLVKRVRWNVSFKKYIASLDKKKSVIICGDMNVAHKKIDLANPTSNLRTAGYTEEERRDMTSLLGDLNLVDAFRHLWPNKDDSYTFWSYKFKSRERNIGWRLDYILVSDRIKHNVKDVQIKDKVLGSDHCPIIGIFSCPNTE